MGTEYVPPKRSKALDLEKLASIPSFYLLEADWAQEKLGFYWDKTGRNEFYVMDLATCEYRQITDGELPRAIRAGYVWGRDNRTIYFAKDKEGNEQHDIFALDTETRQMRQVTNSPTSQDYPMFVTPDDKWLILLSTRHGTHNLLKVRTDGSEEVPLTAHSHRVSYALLSADGRFIAYSHNETDTIKNNDIYLYDMQKNSSELLLRLSKESREGPDDWHPDGKRLLVHSNISGVYQAGVLDIETKNIMWVGDGQHDEYGFRFVSGGSKFVTLRAKDALVYPVIYETETGTGSVPDFPKGVAMPGTVALNGGALVLLVSTPVSPSDIVLLDLNTNTQKTLLETDMGDINGEALVMCEYVHYKSTDGLDIPALLYKPKHRVRGKRYPGLVMVHGGPSAHYMYNFDMKAQYFVSMGIVVLLPNVRGSTGYGCKFLNMNLRDFGGMDLADVGAGHAYLKSLPYVAGDRIGVQGGSYGGYMAFNCAVKQPGLWAFTAPSVGFANLWTFYSDAKPHSKQLIKEYMGAPGDDDKLWRDRSPLFHAENVKDPMLIIHGANDPRCPVRQSRDFKDRLLELGKKEGKDGDFECHEFADEGHGSSSDIRGRTRTWKILADFMERRLKR